MEEKDQMRRNLLVRSQSAKGDFAKETEKQLQRLQLEDQSMPFLGGGEWCLLQPTLERRRMDQASVPSFWDMTILISLDLRSQSCTAKVIAATHSFHHIQTKQNYTYTARSELVIHLRCPPVRPRRRASGTSYGTPSDRTLRLHKSINLSSSNCSIF